MVKLQRKVVFETQCERTGQSTYWAVLLPVDFVQTFSRKIPINCFCLGIYQLHPVVTHVAFEILQFMWSYVDSKDVYSRIYLNTTNHSEVLRIKLLKKEPGRNGNWPPQWTRVSVLTAIFK